MKLEEFLSYITIFIIVFGRFALIYIVLRAILIACKRANSRRYFKNNVVDNNLSDSNVKKTKVYNDVTKLELKRFKTDDINSLKDYFYNIFFRFETAYNNLDFNEMRLLSTKEMYNNYYTGINLDLKVGKKKIISNIERKNVIIYELDSTISKQVLSAMIEVSYVSYTLNKYGNIISGNRNEAITERFEVTFRKDFERKEVIKCPNCGADVVGNKCEYCRKTIKNEEFKISSIKKIID